MTKEEVTKLDKAITDIRIEVQKNPSPENIDQLLYELQIDVFKMEGEPKEECSNCGEMVTMTSERIKEIQQQTAYPESVSVMLALNQVWNECEQLPCPECKQSKPCAYNSPETCFHPDVYPQGN